MEQNHCILAVSPTIACVFFAFFVFIDKLRQWFQNMFVLFLPPAHHPAWQAVSTPKTWNHPHCFSRTWLGKNTALMIMCSLIVLPMSPVRFFQSLILGERHNGWVSTKQPRILQSWAILGNLRDTNDCTCPLCSMFWYTYIWFDFMVTCKRQIYHSHGAYGNDLATH